MRLVGQNDPGLLLRGEVALAPRHGQAQRAAKVRRSGREALSSCGVGCLSSVPSLIRS